MNTEATICKAALLTVDALNDDAADGRVFVFSLINGNVGLNKLNCGGGDCWDELSD